MIAFYIKQSSLIIIYFHTSSIDINFQGRGWGIDIFFHKEWICDILHQHKQTCTQSLKILLIIFNLSKNNALQSQQVLSDIIIDIYTLHLINWARLKMHVINTCNIIFIGQVGNLLARFHWIPSKMFTMNIPWDFIIRSYVIRIITDFYFSLICCFLDHNPLKLSCHSNM